MLSFSTPCLRWKFILAALGQGGWPGFIAPYQTRYLTKDVKISTTPSYGYGTPAQSATTVREEVFNIDRLTGNVTWSPDPVIAEADFPYATTLTEDPAASETWQVTDTYFKHVYNNGYFVIQTEVTLSNPYSIAQLDADLDAAIAAVDWDAVPWGDLMVASSSGFNLSDVNNAIPAQWNYAGYVETLNVVPLRAAAYTAFTPGLVSAQGWFPNQAVKVVGRIAMAGDYCLNTFYIDYNLDVLNQTCANGVGSCAAPFQIIPPPLNPGTNAYITLTPNGQCGE